MERTALPASQPHAPQGAPARRHATLPLHLTMGFWVKASAVLLISLFAFQASQTRSDASRQVSSTLTVIAKLQTIPSALKDAETGQRGFLLTGDPTYLTPYNHAQSEFAAALRELRTLLADNAVQKQRIDLVEQLAQAKFKELAETIKLQREGDRQGALSLVHDGTGIQTMGRTALLVPP